MQRCKVQESGVYAPDLQGFRGLRPRPGRVLFGEPFDKYWKDQVNTTCSRHVCNAHRLCLSRDTERDGVLRSLQSYLARLEAHPLGPAQQASYGPTLNNLNGARVSMFLFGEAYDKFWKDRVQTSCWQCVSFDLQLTHYFLCAPSQALLYDYVLEVHECKGAGCMFAWFRVLRPRPSGFQGFTP